MHRCGLTPERLVMGDHDVGKTLLVAAVALGLSAPTLAQTNKMDAGSGPTKGAVSTTDAGSPLIALVTLVPLWAARKGDEHCDGDAGDKGAHCVPPRSRQIAPTW